MSPKNTLDSMKQASQDSFFIQFSRPETGVDGTYTSSTETRSSEAQHGRRGSSFCCRGGSGRMAADAAADAAAVREGGSMGRIRSTWFARVPKCQRCS